MAALPIVTAVFSAVSAISQGQAASNQAKQQSYVSDYNAKVAKNQERSALDISAQNQEQTGKRSRAILANQRAAAVQSGTGAGGSNLDILEQSATAAELESLNVAYGGLAQAQGFQNQAVIENYQAAGYRRNAKDAKTAGYLNAASSIFSSAKGGAFKGLGSIGSIGTIRTAPRTPTLGYGS